MRRAGVRVAVPQSTLDASQVLLPGIFIVLVTWIGARFAAEGTIGTGELVAFYGYAAFLVIPLRTAAEAVDKITRSFVGARRMLDVLAVDAPIAEAADPAAEPPAGVPLVDERSGAVAEPGELTCVVSADPAEASSSPTGSAASSTTATSRSGGVRLADLPLATVRRRIVLSETDPMLFSGSLRHQLDPWGQTDGEAEVRRAIATANAEDVLDALPEGLDAHVEERGRSFSGGQRQRLALARALLVDPEILVLVEPTSAVDAHTEARIARRLREARHGRTTVVVTASPLVLDQADRVLFLAEGRVVAAGTHRELLDTTAAYRDTVTRGEDE